MFLWNFMGLLGFRNDISKPESYCRSKNSWQKSF